MGHVDIACTGPEVLYFCILGFECHRQAVDAVSGFSKLLGSNGGSSFNGGGKAEGHCAGNFAEFFLAEADEGLGRARGERWVCFVWWVNTDMERWWGDFLD